MTPLSATSGQWRTRFLLLFLTMTSVMAMIYLEEFDGALEFDDAEMPSSSSSSSSSITLDRTPGHYMMTIVPPTPITTTTAPSAMPTTMSLGSANTGSTNPLNNNNNTNADTATATNITPSFSPHIIIANNNFSSPPYPTTINNNGEYSNAPSTAVTSSSIPTIIPDKTSLFSTGGGRTDDEDQTQKNHAHLHSSLETYTSGSVRPTSSVTSFTSSLVSSLSSSSSSSSSSLSSSSSSDGFYFFDDLSMIHDSRNFVYYDSKQARFGADLGPRGNAFFVNIMLPPRWYNYGSDDDDDDDDDNDSSFRGVRDLGAAEKGGSYIIIDAENETRSGSTDIRSSSNNNYTTVEDVWWNENQGRGNTTTTENIFNYDNNYNSTTTNNNNTTDINTTATTTNNNKTSFLQGDDSLQYNASVMGQHNDDVSNIEDYFCLEDFIHWKEKHQQKSSSPSESSSSASSALNSTTANISTIDLPQPNLADVINSTRPLTILVRRGRCTFESKAQMAMVINEILSNSGRSNRIDHIIIYNNGTDDDDDARTEERLVDMRHENEMYEDDTTVGLLYITSSSGRDLIRRILERQVSTFISPHLVVPMPSTKQSDHTLDRRRRRHHRHHRHRHLKESESNKPDWEDDAIIDIFSDAGYNDKQISHGWWFPATLTRFCYSCGSEMQYGLVWDDDDVGDVPSFNNGSEMTSQPYGGDFPQDYFSDWFLYIRQFLIAILVMLLVGPVLVMTFRWFIVGGTFRVVTDENGVRRLRVISPNLEAFVNGTPGTVEINGTKLDRAQVYSLPEIVYTDSVDEESGDGYINTSTSVDEECSDQVSSSMHDEGVFHNSTQSAASLAAPSNASPTRSGRFVSSSCCPICIDEFTPGEHIRMLPRCSHAFHTECILPWLTERQGCCPVCKVPVLPDELQRTRSLSRRLGRRGRL